MVQKSYRSLLIVRAESMPQRMVLQNKAENKRTGTQLTMKPFAHPGTNKGLQSPAFKNRGESSSGYP